MIHRLYLYAAMSCLIVLPALAAAQQPMPTTTMPASSKTKASDKIATAARREPDPVAEQNRLTAISLLTTLADDARSFRDEALRARVQARAADALWETDKKRARELFRRAWDAANLADTESQRRIEETRRAARDSGKPTARLNPPNLRAEVLRLSSRRDRALGEELLASLDTDKDRNAPNATETSRQIICPAPGESLPPALGERLSLARQLLSADDAERALQFAEPALHCATREALNFLSGLRAKDAAAADARFLSLLTRAATDSVSDANTVSFLSAYVLTPFMYVKVDRKGGINTNQYAERTAPPTLSPALRAAFFRTAAQILLRPVPLPDQDKSTGGVAGTYFVIARLLPLFEQYAPNYAAALHAQLSALAGEAPENFRNGKERWLTEGLLPADTARDETAELPERLKRASNSGERDSLYAEAAAATSHTDYAKARELTDKIEDDELRSRVRAFVDFIAVNRAVSRKDADEVIRLARTGELIDLHRAMAFTEAARLLTKTDPQRALDLLNEARTAAGRIDGADPNRARALVAVATHLFKLDRVRAWDVVAEVVKAANTAESFTGEDGQVAIRLVTKNGVSAMNNGVPEFDLTGIFSTLALDDFTRAVELTKTFTGEAPRAISTLAIARAVLNEKHPKTIR
ncbi:MAG: hypothetical protein ABR577_07915 [Pyrinomonadaceae bacterium]